MLTGLHLLYILWRNRMVRGCPYEVNITAGSSSSSSAASKVLCSGEGLREGVVSQLFRVHVDARRAPPGLQTYCFVYGRNIAHAQWRNFKLSPLQKTQYEPPAPATS